MPASKSVIHLTQVAARAVAEKLGTEMIALDLSDQMVLSEVFLIATCFALGAAFLNAAFGFCLGCQFYLILLRAKSRLTSRN